MAYIVEKTDFQQARNSMFALRERNSEKTDINRYDWLYTNGNQYQTSCFVLKSSDGKIIGMNGAFVRKIYIGDECVNSGQAIDLLVDKKHRTVGPALQLQRAVLDYFQQLDIKLAYGIPLPAAEAIMKRLGYKSLGKYYRFIMPLHSRFYLRKYLPRVIVSMISPIVDIVLRIRTGNCFLKQDAKLKFNPSDDIDVRFDELWNQRGHKFQITGLRTSAYLKWRFIEMPEKLYKVFTMNTIENTLNAYVIYRVVDDSVEIADMFYRDNADLKCLFVMFCRYMYKSGYKAVSFRYFGTQNMVSTLRHSGFIQRAEELSLLVKLDVELEEAYPGLSNKDCWYLTDADKDP